MNWAWQEGGFPRTIAGARLSVQSEHTTRHKEAFCHRGHPKYISAANWPNVITPDQLHGQATQAAGQQVAMIDRNGNATTDTWDRTNELTGITDGNGQTVTLTYAPSGLVSIVTDPARRSLTLGYNAANQLTTLTDPDGTPWNYTYTAANQLTTVGDPTEFRYDPAGSVATVTLPTGGSDALIPAQAQGLSSNPDTPAPAVPLAGTAALFSTPGGNSTQTYVDGLGYGLPQQTISPRGSTSITNRDANGLPWLAADGLGAPTRDFFDSDGNIVSMTCASIYGDDG